MYEDQAIQLKIHDSIPHGLHLQLRTSRMHEQY